MSDYIKREDVKHVINKSKYYGKKVWYDILDDVYDIPSADVAPIRHGRWRSGACSKCGGIKPMTRIEDCGLLIWEAPYKLNYCPNCGVKMDGEEDDKA